ncbi:hypothetical protein CSC2_35040 [Clostridium zeae]|uniref:Uncharacterized protein n=1 Tax=Clostridium zeae TaxID=2759022 RepID=A0ABQ1EDS7_9CLOT|nr:CBO0543 family protein [Clostridium zeae]GFZ32978.1 hypothetical protein CSC2_35040 [Clostridium zeae]
MRIDNIMFFLIIGGSILSVLIFIRKKDIKKAFFATLLAQTFTWPMGLLFTQLNRIAYPVRLFPKAVSSSFLNGYIMNPIIFAIYYTHFPINLNVIYRCLYTLFISMIPTLIELCENKYTNLIKYKSWHWYYTWLLILITYFILRKYLDWFFKNTSQKGVEKDET